MYKYNHIYNKSFCVNSAGLCELCNVKCLFQNRRDSLNIVVDIEYRLHFRM
jgi:hypothetical protein